MLSSVFQGLRIASGARTMKSSLLLKAKPLTTTNPFMVVQNALSQKRTVTTNQKMRFKIYNKPEKPKPYRTKEFEGAPMRRGTVLKVLIIKPKKPNSAQRKAVKVRLSNGKVIIASIGGEGHNLQEHHTVFIRGATIRDLVGMKYRCIRGKGDLQPVVGRVTSRSKYGVKKPKKAAA
ncbi:hypothetical protein QEN19_000952 [Hanseniaspora menglaensis]